jgi:pyruvate-formate lyase-activating enzyme
MVGGIYATLCPEHLRKKFKNRIEIHRGLMEKVEDVLPDYSLVPYWNASIVFSSRGCINKCRFCSVPQIEPEFKAKSSIKHLIYPGHKRVVLWDNNILASPYWENIFDELEELNLEVDFNQGLDARLIEEEVALKLMDLKVPILRLAYDSNGVKKSLEKAINLLKSVGIKGRRIIVYCLYNHLDTPEDFLNRTKDLLQWEVVAYPMRYEPLKPRPKNTYISPNWTAEQLEMVADARRVIGYGGAFPPYEGLKKKILNAKNFEKAFKLRPRQK